MGKHRKIEAAKNTILRMKAVPAKLAADDALNVDTGTAEMTEAAAENEVIVQPQLRFPGNDEFFMTSDGERFFCMLRAGAQDVVHASFFSEVKCRGHMLNSHNLT